ncbi:MAG: response regulator transcription factor, partial [Gemmatimonadota bacterium]
ARVRAHLRRVRLPAPAGEKPIEADGLVIDPVRRVIERDGTHVHLTPTEWDLLRAFALHSGRTLTHAHLFNAVWNGSKGDPQQYLRVHIANLRRKIERDSLRPRLIVTEPGVGYRFDASP